MTDAISRVKNWLYIVAKSHTILPARAVVEDIAALVVQLEACQKECEEQARLNGMGASREAKLMTQLERAEETLREVRFQVNQESPVNCVCRYFANKGKD